MAYHDLKGQKITIAHVGDSRGVIGMVKNTMAKKKLHKCEDLTVDHKPDLKKERERIENSDPPGRVVFDGFYNYRVFAKAGMYPGLNMSRALGDVTAHKEAGLTAEPDINVIDLKTFAADSDLVVMLLYSD